MGREIISGIKTQPIKNREEEIEPIMNDPSLGWVTKSESQTVIAGTYLHSIFDNSKWRRAWLNQIREKKNLCKLPLNTPNYSDKREYLINSLADIFEEHVDLSPILNP